MASFSDGRLLGVTKRAWHLLKWVSISKLALNSIERKYNKCEQEREIWTFKE